MADIAGLNCLVQIGNVSSGASSYTTLEGQTDCSMSGSTNSADSTAKDNAGWQTGVATTRSGEVECSGNMRTSRAQLDKLETAWRTGSTYDCRILFDGTRGYKGDFYVTKFNVQAGTNDLVKYSITLTPAGALTAVP